MSRWQQGVALPRRLAGSTAFSFVEALPNPHQSRSEGRRPRSALCDVGATGPTNQTFEISKSC